MHLINMQFEYIMDITVAISNIFPWQITDEMTHLYLANIILELML